MENLYTKKFLVSHKFSFSKHAYNSEDDDKQLTICSVGKMELLISYLGFKNLLFHPFD